MTVVNWASDPLPWLIQVSHTPLLKHLGVSRSGLGSFVCALAQDSGGTSNVDSLYISGDYSLIC